MSKARSVILVVIGLLVVLLMVYAVGAGDVIDELMEVDPYLFGLALICQFTAVVLWSVRWRILLNPFGSVRLRNSLMGIFIGLFFNNITPVARAGGEPFRAYFMEKKEHIDFEHAFATVAIDRVLDSLPFMIIITLSMAYFILILDISFQMIIVLSLAFLFNLLLLSLVLYFSFSLEAAKKLMFALFRIVARFSKRVRKYENQVETAVEQYHSAIRTLSSRRGDLVVCLSISFVFWFLVILRNYLVVIALGYEVNFMVIVVVQMVGALMGILPILPGGLGSIEAVMVFLFFSFNFPVDAAMTASLLDRFISFWITTAVSGTVVFVESGFLRE